MKGQWEGGKGPDRRPTQIDSNENDLRWELISKKTSPERKQEIIEILEKLKQGKPND